MLGLLPTEAVRYQGPSVPGGGWGTAPGGFRGWALSCPFWAPTVAGSGSPQAQTPLPDPQLLLGPWPHCLSGPACWGYVYPLSVFLGVDKQTEDKLEGEERRPGRWTKGDPAHLTPPVCLFTVPELLSALPWDKDASPRGISEAPDLGSGNLVGSAALLETRTMKTVTTKTVPRTVTVPSAGLAFPRGPHSTLG